MRLYSRITVCTVFLVLSASAGRTQELFRLSGQVIDGETDKPLPYAQVSLKNASLGTTSNENGEFILFIPSLMKQDTMVFYYLGYSPVTVALAGLDTGRLDIRMNPAALQLKEVEIVGLDAQEVIRKAVLHIPENYGDDSLLLTAFVRVRKILNNRQVELAEAVVKDLKDGYYPYSRSKKDHLEKWENSNIPLLVKGRVESDTNSVNALADIGKNATCLSCYFKEDIAEFYPRTVLDEKEFRYYDFRMEEMSAADGKKLYHILFDQKPGINEMLWKGELFIEPGTFAIEKVILKPSPNGYGTWEKKKYLRNYTLLNIPGWIEEMPLGQTVVTYSVREGKWTLNTIRNEYMVGFSNTQSGKKIRYTYKSDVVVTDATRNKQELQAFTGNRSTGISQRWDQIVGPPDEKFWINYNFLPIEK